LAGQLRETLPVLLEHVVAVSLAVHLALDTLRARYETLADLTSTYLFSRTFSPRAGWFYNLWLHNCTLRGRPWCRALQSILNFKQQVRVAGQLREALDAICGQIIAVSLALNITDLTTLGSCDTDAGLVTWTLWLQR